MILIFGGAFQGKFEFAASAFGVENLTRFECLNGIDFSASVLDRLERYVLSAIERGENPLAFISDNLEKFSEKIVIMEDISCGVVPISPLNRKWREENGRVMTVLSTYATEVFRVYCGIGTKLK